MELIHLAPWEAALVAYIKRRIPLRREGKFTLTICKNKNRSCLNRLTRAYLVVLRQLRRPIFTVYYPITSLQTENRFHKYLQDACRVRKCGLHDFKVLLRWVIDPISIPLCAGRYRVYMDSPSNIGTLRRSYTCGENAQQDEARENP